MGFSTGEAKGPFAELNLVPFIELLSTSICFLLMTAVWMDLGAMEVKQGAGTEGEKKPRLIHIQWEKPGTKAKLEVLEGNQRVGEAVSVSGKTAEEVAQSLKAVVETTIKKGGITGASVETVTELSYGGL